MDRPLVAILILNWNGKADTLECLASLESTAYPKNRVGLFVVDNGSTDGSAAAVRERFNAMRGEGWRMLELVELPENLGFGRGNNAGYARIGPEYEYVYLSNNDVAFYPDTLERIVETFERDVGIGVVGARVVEYDNPESLSHGAGFVNWFLAGTRSVDAGAPVECDFVTGCALAVRKSVADRLDTLFDQDFFAYWEDTDLCARVRRLGYKVVYCPAARIRHKVGAATGGGRSPARVYYEIHGKLLYANRHLNFPERLAFYLLFLVRIPAFFARSLIEQPARSPKLLRAYLRGVLHGLVKRPGQRFAE